MKDKNLPNDYNSLTLEELTKEANKMIEDLESQKNLENSILKIKEAAYRNAKIICLPELFLSPYFCQTEKHSNFDLAEKIPGPTTKIFSSLAKQLKIILMISLFISIS